MSAYGLADLLVSAYVLCGLAVLGWLCLAPRAGKIALRRTGIGPFALAVAGVYAWPWLLRAWRRGPR